MSYAINDDGFLLYVPCPSHAQRRPDCRAWCVCLTPHRGIYLGRQRNLHRVLRAVDAHTHALLHICRRHLLSKPDDELGDLPHVDHVLRVFLSSINNFCASRHLTNEREDSEQTEDSAMAYCTRLEENRWRNCQQNLRQPRISWREDQQTPPRFIQLRKSTRISPVARITARVSKYCA